MAITIASQLNFVPSMQDIAKKIEKHNLLLETITMLRTTEVTALRKALVRHTVDPIVTRCEAAAEKKGEEPNLLQFLVRAKTLEGTWKESRLGIETVALRVDRLMNAAMSPLLSYYNMLQDASWFLEAIEADLNTMLQWTSPRLIIRTRPSTLEAPASYKGAPTMEFYAVNRS